jgi:hypothetical protein
MTQILKAAEDAFNKVVWTDDARVCRHILGKFYSPKPRLEIEVRPWRLSDSEVLTEAAARENGTGKAAPCYELQTRLAL